MIRTIGIAVAILLLFLNTLDATEQTLPTYTTGTSPKLFAVIFGITINSDKSIENIRINRVIDPSSGSPDAIDLPVPQIYIESAKMHIKAQNYEPQIENGKAKEFFTYFFFDPERPEIVITEIKNY